MKAIVVTDQAAGTAGMKLVERPEPQGAALASLSGANYGDVVVQVHASGFTGDELSWPSTWIDRLGRDRTPSIPGHELAGVVTALGYGTTQLIVCQRSSWAIGAWIAPINAKMTVGPLPALLHARMASGSSFAPTGQWKEKTAPTARARDASCCN